MIVVLFSTTPSDDLDVEVLLCSTVRGYRFVDDRYERDLRTMFVGDSAIRAANWAPS
jgi:hypothetical protein